MTITKDYLSQKRAGFVRQAEALKTQHGYAMGAVLAVDEILKDLEKTEDWSASKPIDIAPPVDEPQYGADIDPRKGY